MCKNRTPLKMVAGVLYFVPVFYNGCATRSYAVPPGEPVRIRETIPNAKVWVYTQDGREVESVTDIPAGWYCLPDPGEKP